MLNALPKYFLMDFRAPAAAFVTFEPTFPCLAADLNILSATFDAVLSPNFEAPVVNTFSIASLQGGDLRKH